MNDHELTRYPLAWPSHIPRTTRVEHSRFKQTFGRTRDVYGDYHDPIAESSITAPATPEADRWKGWGTALKPAWEPIILARKPFKMTVATNVLKHGTGALNIDGCRIEGTKTPAPVGQYVGSSIGPNGHSGIRSNEEDSLGRWPANVVLDEEAARLLDEQTGELGLSTGGYRGQGTHGLDGWGMASDPNKTPVGFGDTGGASRFFYTAKASRSERNKGLDGMPEIERQTQGRDVVNVIDRRDGKGPVSVSARIQPAANHHPTVKPVDLMQWLVRLITPPGGTILDPFLGSGTTGIAADREGFDFIGIELSAEYAEIARRRITGDAPMFANVSTE